MAISHCDDYHREAFTKNVKPAMTTTKAMTADEVEAEREAAAAESEAADEA